MISALGADLLVVSYDVAWIEESLGTCLSYTRQTNRVWLNQALKARRTRLPSTGEVKQNTLVLMASFPLCLQQGRYETVDLSRVVILPGGADLIHLILLPKGVSTVARHPVGLPAGRSPRNPRMIRAFLIHLSLTGVLSLQVTNLFGVSQLGVTEGSRVCSSFTRHF